MELGSWGEWAGAIGTTAATVVALFLAARDEEERRERLRARGRLHAGARWQLVVLRRAEAGIEGVRAQPDRVGDVLWNECSPLYVDAQRLGPVRQRRAVRILRAIYGAEHVDRLALAVVPHFGDGETGHSRLGLGSIGDAETAAALKERLGAALRFRGTEQTSGPEFEALVAAFERLAKV